MLSPVGMWGWETSEPPQQDYWLVTECGGDRLHLMGRGQRSGGKYSGMQNAIIHVGM